MVYNNEIQSMFEEWFGDWACENGLEGVVDLYAHILATAKEECIKQIMICTDYPND